jgi:glycosyltransferase involved in cell wall biosynthesis
MPGAELPKKTICIDAYNLAQAKGSGIATYARNLISALRNLEFRTEILYGPEQEPGRDNLLNEVRLFDAPPPPSSLRRLETYLRGFGRRSPLSRSAERVVQTGAVITRQVANMAPPCDGLWASRDLFHTANRSYSALGHFTPVRFSQRDGAPPDIMHWTCPLPLRAPGLANLYTIHDLIPLRLPFTTLDNKHRFLNLCREICGAADHVVTVSEHSRQDIVRLLGVDEARISVTYQSVTVPDALLERPDTDVAKEIEGVFGLGWRGYFLFFGAIEPKKNLSRVIAAYLASGVAAPLIIIGGKAWLEEDETQLIHPDLVAVRASEDGKTRHADRIRRYEYLPYELLVSLIRGAKATLLPSLYEGFGLPVLESMLLSTPVLASTEGSLPEVAGDAALLVDPYDTQAIRRAIESLDADEDLRADLTSRGLRQAAKFSPAAYESRLAGVYRQYE